MCCMSIYSTLKHIVYLSAIFVLLCICFIVQNANADMNINIGQNNVSDNASQIFYLSASPSPVIAPPATYAPAQPQTAPTTVNTQPFQTTKVENLTSEIPSNTTDPLAPLTAEINHSTSIISLTGAIILLIGIVFPILLKSRQKE